MKLKIALLLGSLLWLPVQGISVTHAALNAPIDLTNPRIVPVYGAQSGTTVSIGRDAFYSGFSIHLASCFRLLTRNIDLMN
jgi:hypothetical protein